MGTHKKLTIIQEANMKLEKRYLGEQVTSGQEPNKDAEIKKLGLDSIDAVFKKYGFERNDNPPKIRSLHQYIVTYDKKPLYSGSITDDGESGVRILTKTPLKDIVLQKCNTKPHSLDANYIPLNKNNVDCVLGRLTNQITD